MKLRGMMPSAQRPRSRVAINVLRHWCCSSRLARLLRHRARCAAAGGAVRRGGLLAARSARRPPAATARTRSMAAASGGYPSIISHRRSARRAAAGVAAVSARASVGSTAAARDSASAASSAAVSAVRTSRGTVSRPAIESISGSSSWRTRLRTKRGSSLDGSPTGTRPRSAHSRRVSVRRRASSGRVGRRCHRRQPVEPGAAEQVDEQRLGTVVGRVPGQRTGGKDGLAGGAERVLRGWGRRRCRRRTTWQGTPSRPANAAASVASSAEDGRRPWSTWIAVTSNPAADARTSSAVESGAAGERADDVGPGLRKRAAGEQLVDDRGAARHGQPSCCWRRFG